jgi:hypothetical protein
MKPTVLYLLLGFVFHPLVVGRGRGRPRIMLFIHRACFSSLAASHCATEERW